MGHANNHESLSILKSFSAREQFMLVGLMLQNAMDLLEVGMFSIALPSVREEFSLSVEVLALVVAIRVLPRIGLMPIYGLLGDKFGKKRIFLAGLIIFIVGAFISFISPSLLWLVIGRLLTGVGGGILPISMAIITDNFPSERRGRILGIWSTGAPLGALIGPPLSGVIIEIFGWRSIFVFVGVGAILALGLVIRLVPSNPIYSAKSQIDWIGATSLLLLATGFLLATTTSSVFPFGSSINTAFWLIAGIAFLVLGWNTINNPESFIDLSILKNGRLVFPSIAVACRMFALSGMGFLMVLYLVNVFDKTPGSVGTFVLFHRVPLFFAIFIGGILADRMTSRRATSIAMFVQAIGMLMLGFFNPERGDIFLVPGMIVGGLGAGFSLNPFTKGAIASLGDQKSGFAAGLFNMTRFTGSALSTPILGFFLVQGFEQYNGIESVPEPYQYSFLLLAGIAFIGAGIASFTPIPSSGEHPLANTTEG